MQASSWSHNYSSFKWPFDAKRYGKEGKNYKKLNISRTGKVFLMK